MIVRSIHEFLALNALPSAFQIYDEMMREELGNRRHGKRDAGEQRPNKILVRDAIRQNHAERSARANKPARPNKHSG